MARGGGGRGKGVRMGHYSFIARVFQRGVSRYEFPRASHEMTYIAGAYCASLNFAYAPETSESEHCDK